MQLTTILKHFVAEACISHPAGLCTVIDFAGSFRAWAQVKGYAPPHRQEIVAALTALGYAIGKRNDRWTIVGLSFNATRFVVDQGKVVRTTMKQTKLSAAPATVDRASA